MFEALANLMEQKNLEWNENLEMISDWEQVEKIHYVNCQYPCHFKAERAAWVQTFIVTLLGCLFHPHEYFSNLYFLSNKQDRPYGESVRNSDCQQSISPMTRFILVCFLSCNSTCTQVRFYIWHHLGMAHFPIEDHDQVLLN